MNLVKKVLMFVGFVVLASALVSVLSPKATHALVATLVQVANTSANPVPNKDVDFPVRAVIQSPNCIGNAYPPGNVYASCSPSYTVPAGQRFAIEQLEAFCFTPKGNNLTQAFIQISEQGSDTSHYLPLTSQGDFEGQTEFIENQQVRYYADPGSTIRFQATTSDATGATSCTYQVNGYLASYP